MMTFKQFGLSVVIYSTIFGFQGESHDTRQVGGTCRAFQSFEEPTRDPDVWPAPPPKDPAVWSGPTQVKMCFWRILKVKNNTTVSGVKF